MKGILIFSCFLASISACAQTFGWGSTDVRYSVDEQPKDLTTTIALNAWKGEVVNAQAVMTSPKTMEKVSFKVSVKTEHHIHRRM